MKIGIVTLTDYTNYGNRLQNYALNTLLVQSNLEVINLPNCYIKTEWINTSESRIKRIVKAIIPFNIFRLICVQKEKKTRQNERVVGFVDFTKKYSDVLPSLYFKNERDMNKYFSSIDYFVSGSDQVWNPRWGKWQHFLTFAPDEKKLSFAASIGVEAIPNDELPFFKKYISRMKYISVREKSAVGLIERLTGREAMFTLDPTLLLEKKYWDGVIHKPEKLFIPSSYICTYFLGDIPEAVQDYSNKLNKPIIALNYAKQPEIFSLPPENFLYLIKHAHCVLTDSFHAVAFSIVFHKQFYVFKRNQKDMQDMFTRIDSVLSELRLLDRIQIDSIVEREEISSKRWDEIDAFLDEQREVQISRLLENMD